LLRHRNELVQMAAQHVTAYAKGAHTDEPSDHHVISDITGLTGSRSWMRFWPEERDPVKLADLRHPSIQADEETIRKSLEATGVKNICSPLHQSRQIVHTLSEQHRSLRPDDFKAIRATI